MELQTLAPTEIRSLMTCERHVVNTVAACRMAKIHRATLYRWIAANKVEWLRTPTGQLRIYADSVLRAPSGNE